MAFSDRFKAYELDWLVPIVVSLISSHFLSHPVSQMKGNVSARAANTLNKYPPTMKLPSCGMSGLSVSMGRTWAP
jgi:hypothetical protein